VRLDECSISLSRLGFLAGHEERIREKVVNELPKLVHAQFPGNYGVVIKPVPEGRLPTYTFMAALTCDQPVSDPTADFSKPRHLLAVGRHRNAADGTDRMPASFHRLEHARCRWQFLSDGVDQQTNHETRLLLRGLRQTGNGLYRRERQPGHRVDLRLPLRQVARRPGSFHRGWVSLRDGRTLSRTSVTRNKSQSFLYLRIPESSRKLVSRRV